MFAENVRERLFKMQDTKFQAFQRRLVPTVPTETIIGVRAADLQALAKALRKSGEADAFLEMLPHLYLEENLLHGYLINLEKDFEKALRETERYLPYLDNWMTCDLLSPKAFRNHLDELSPEIERWRCSSQEFTIRFAIEMRMTFYLDASFHASYLEEVAQIRNEALYVRLMIAWFFATALAKQYDAALPYLKQRRLERWTHNKTIQKAVESFRISDEQKEYLKTLRYSSYTVS